MSGVRSQLITTALIALPPSLLGAFLFALLSCTGGRGIRSTTSSIEGDFTIMWLDSTTLNYNLVVLCLGDKGPFTVVSDKDSTRADTIHSELERLVEGNTYHLQIRLWGVMDQDVIEPTLRVANLESYWVPYPCKPGGDTLAFLWTHNSVKTRIYRSDDIVGLCTRARRGLE